VLHDHILLSGVSSCCLTKYLLKHAASHIQGKLELIPANLHLELRVCKYSMYYPTEEQWCCHPQHSKKAMLCGWIIISSTNILEQLPFELLHTISSPIQKSHFLREADTYQNGPNHARVQPRHIAASTSSSSYRCTFRHTPTSPLPKKPTSTA
jgi:hypothetical protein